MRVRLHLPRVPEGPGLQPVPPHPPISLRWPLLVTYLWVMLVVWTYSAHMVLSIRRSECSIESTLSNSMDMLHNYQVDWGAAHLHEPNPLDLTRCDSWVLSQTII